MSQMQALLAFTLIILLEAALPNSIHAGPASVTWNELEPLPDAEGFGGGFVGVSHGALIFAGGANFPDKPVWEGGSKQYHDTLFVLESPSGSWKQLDQRLPTPLAYGLSVTHGDRVVCVGGDDGQKAQAGVFSMEWKDGRIALEKLPDLPRPCTYGVGGLIGDRVYLAAGSDGPPFGGSATSFRAFWSLDLAKKGSAWRELPPWPGSSRFEAASAVLDGKLYLLSGMQIIREDQDSKKPGTTSRLLRDAYAYTPGNEWEAGRWKRIADPPRGAAGAASPAPAFADGRFLILGGWDDYAVKMGNRGLAMLSQHPGVNRECLIYDATADRWSTVGGFPDDKTARVTAPVTFWKDRWLVVSGEAKPGVRSPRVFAVRMKPSDR